MGGGAFYAMGKWEIVFILLVVEGGKLLLKQVNGKILQYTLMRF